MKNNRLYLKHNSFVDDVPIVVVLKAMGMETDQEIIQLVGSEGIYADGLAPSLNEASQLAIYTQSQALEWLSHKIKAYQRPTRGGRRLKTKVQCYSITLFLL